MKTAAILSVAVLVWSLAVLCKLALARSRGEPYTFTQWDGGLVLRGRVLGRAGATGFAVFCVVLVAVSASMLARIGAS
jgi:hypothetical protein